MRIGIGKLGKSVLFNSNNWGAIGGDNEAPILFENLIHLNAYPNPTIENITISIENFNGIIQTEVLDLFGNRLQTTNETTISLKDYSKGIYILKIAYGDIVEEVKVIKE